MKKRKQPGADVPPIADRLQQKASFAPQRKRKPRGKPFEKGNKYGIEHRFRPGESGNPGGLPGTDLAALAARRLFEASVGELPKIPKDFNAYGFSVLAERAFGSVKRSVDVNMSGKLTLKQVLEAEERAEKNG